MRPVLCPVLVGRDDETGRLLVALEAARAGHGGTVLLAGDAGLGKSRLVRELAGAARRDGCAVLIGRAVASGVPTPFRPFAEALASALRPGGLPDDAGLDPFRPALARLVPQVLPGRDAADESLIFLGEAVLRLLRLVRPAGAQGPGAGEPGQRAAQAEACLLVLEDLHWADRETLALVEYVADNLRAERVLCVGTFRPAEGGEAAELAAKLEARGSADVVTLRRLDNAAMARMAAACLAVQAQGGDPLEPPGVQAQGGDPLESLGVQAQRGDPLEPPGVQAQGGDPLEPPAGGLPEAAQAFVAARAEGVPFLVEEILAGLLEDGRLVRRGGRWETTGPIATGVPVTFADAVGRRLEGIDADARRVLGAAAVLGRRFDWSLLGAMMGAGEDDVLAALRLGLDRQLIATGEDGFWFRHALTHEAVLGSLLPPERMALAGRGLTAVRAAHPSLPGDWCMLAADLAEQAGDAGQASELLLAAGRRGIEVGALASAEKSLTRARALVARSTAGPGAVSAAVERAVDEALTEALALSGQVDRAIEMGQRLLNRIGSPATAPATVPSSAALHLRIARAAIAGGKWADAAASVDIARAAPDAQAARVDAIAAQVAEGRKRTAEADRLACAALRAAQDADLPEVACEALEVIGRIARQTDLEASDRAFTRAASIASDNGLPLWHVRALFELGTNDMIQTESVDRMLRARELAAGQGALFHTAALDLLIAVGLNKQVRADEALEAARRSADAARRFHFAPVLPMALIMQACAHASRGERDQMEDAIAEATSLAPGNRDVLGGAWGYCRATTSLLDEDREQAWVRMETGASLLLASPAAFAPPFLGLWPLLGAALGHDAVSAAERVRAVHGTRRRVIVALIGYADAILAGRHGDADAASAAFAAADARMGPLMEWYRQYARRTVAEAALTDGWGDPVPWLREAAVYFEMRGDEQIAAACRGLLRQAGAPVPRRRPGETGLPGSLRSRNITGREADVLERIVAGLSNREIAGQMFLSPRTVEKHVASLLVKTGLRRRSELAGYYISLDGLDG
jgi:DNA-binding CsgD family transcriptional regulator